MNLQLGSVLVTTTMAVITSIFAIILYRTKIKLEKETKQIREKQIHILDEMQEFGRHFAGHVAKLPLNFDKSTYSEISSVSENSLFNIRRGHFTPEKEKLSEWIVELISSKIDKERKGNKSLNIILVLDAGSTVFPIFKYLCRHPSFQFDRMNSDRVKIITNNLPGVSDLIKYGQIGTKRSARTLFECRILKGFAHSVYGASLNDKTHVDLVDSIKEFKDSIGNSNVKVISVITGNYISVQDGVLARDPNHVSTKSAAIKHADEVYVLAPLGKIVPCSCTYLNDMLELEETDDVRYSKLQNWDECAKKLKVVITTRNENYFSRIKPARMGNHLSRVQQEIREAYKAAKNIEFIEFEPLSDPRIRVQIAVMGEELSLREYEFPHRDLRDKLASQK